MTDPTSPGPSTPQGPWQQNGSTVSYDQGGVTLGTGVAGGDKGPGSLNALGLYVNGVSVFAGDDIIPTLAAFRNIGGRPNWVFVQGRFASGDGFQGDFQWMPGDTTTDNGATIIAPTSPGAAGRYWRVIDTVISADWWDLLTQVGTNGVTTEFQNAINWAAARLRTLLLPARTLQVQGITFPSNTDIIGQAGTVLTVPPNSQVLGTSNTLCNFVFGTSNIRLRRFTLQGYEWTSTAETQAWPLALLYHTGPFLGPIDSIWLEDIQMNGGTFNARFDGITNVALRNVWARKAIDRGIVFGGGIKRIHINGLDIKDSNLEEGLVTGTGPADTTEELIIDNLRISGCGMQFGQEGWDMYSQGSMKKISVSNFQILGCGNGGIEMKTSGALDATHGLNLTMGTPGVVTYPGHPCVEGMAVYFSAQGVLPLGLLPSTPVYFSTVFGPNVNQPGTTLGENTLVSIAVSPGGIMPTGLSAPAGINSVGYYYVKGISNPTAGVFQLASYQAGPAVSITGVATVTFTAANPGVVNWTSHGRAAGDVVSFSASGNVPTALSPGVGYYVLASGLTANAFQISTTAGGTAIDLSAGGNTGVQQGFVGTFSLAAQPVPFYVKNPTANTFNIMTAYSLVRVNVASPGVVNWTNHKLTADTPFTFTNPPNVITMTNANPGTVTWIGHGLAVNSPVFFATTGALPTNIVPYTVYYVSAANFTVNTFQVSATPGGSSINTTAGTQSGRQTAQYGMPPLGFVPGTTYYVRNPTTNAFEFALTPGGSSINTTSQSPAITVNISTPNPATVTWNNHGLTENTQVSFSTTGALPTGLTANTPYYVRQPTTNTFKLSNNPFGGASAGAMVVTSGSQSGVHSAVVGLAGAGTMPVAFSGLTIASISAANPCVITLNGHGMGPRCPFTITTTGTLPAPLTVGTTYYVRAAGLTVNSFAVEDFSGNAINTTGGTQSGVHTLQNATITLADDHEQDIQFANGFIEIGTPDGGGGGVGIQMNTSDGYGNPWPGHHRRVKMSNMRFRGGYTSGPVGTGVGVNGWNGTTIDNCSFENLSLVTALQPVNTANQSQYDITFNSPTVIGCTSLGVIQYGSTDVTFNNVVSYNSGGYSLTGSGTGVSNVTMFGGRYNRLQGYLFNFNGPNLVNNLKVRGLDVDNASNTPMFFGINSGTITGLIEGCRFNCMSFSSGLFDIRASISGTLSFFNNDCALSIGKPTYDPTAGGTVVFTAYNNRRGSPVVAAAAPTISLANPAVVTLAAHGYGNGRAVIFSTTGALPAPIVAWTVYYVINTATNTFQIAATPGGTALDTSAGSQSGTHSVASMPAAASVGDRVVNAPANGTNVFGPAAGAPQGYTCTTFSLTAPIWKAEPSLVA